MRRLRLLLLLSGALLVVGGLVAGSFAQRSRTSLDHTLTLEAEEHAGIAANHLVQASDMALLLAQNPVFASFYAPASANAPAGASDPDVQRRLNAALAFAQVLYRDRIVEACFVDGSGREIAKVVQNRVLPSAELSSDVSASAFVEPAFELEPGKVYQGRPYVSPETGEWVVSTATAVPNLTGGDRAILHFATTVESLRHAGEPSSQQYVVHVVDRHTGKVISDSRAPRRAGVQRVTPADRVAIRLRDRNLESGTFSVAGRRVAYTSEASRLEEDPAVETETTVNANDWMVAVSAPGLPRAWSAPLSAGPLGLFGAGVILLGLASLAYRRHYRYQRERARTDELTGLGNRFALQEQLSHPARRNTAVLLLDLDRFKAVNDTLGHQAGDQLLVEVAGRLRQVTGRDHFVARLGGDEFAVLLQPPDAERRRARAWSIERQPVDGQPSPDEPVDGGSMEAEAGELAETLLAAIRRPMTFEGVPIAVSTSIGIAFACRHDGDPSRLLRCADVAMYHAKRTGAGYCVYAGDQETHSLVKLGLEASLLAAIEQGELVLHYQPIVDARAEQVRRVEALVRWRHPELGLIQPREFVSLAEDSGLARALTLHVLELALDQCAQWHADGLDLPVSVNLSPKNCVDHQLPDAVAAMLAARGLPPSVLRLEITEYAAVGAEAAEVLGRIRRLGVSIALDDFGTGYSSLAYLRLLSVDDIKIDRSFVAALAEAPTDTVIIGSTIDMAHQLGCSVTAEGVEDEATLLALALLGTDSIQGYHVCYPLPADELRRWLNGRQAGVVAGATDGRELRKT